MSGFSKQGLYEQLSSSYGEGFTQAQAQYAVDHVGADWNKEAVQSARSYLEFITSLDAARREPARIEVPPVPPAPMPDFGKVRGPAVTVEPERALAELPPDDPLAVIAEAAAEMGVTERDTAALEYIGEAVGPLLGGDGAAGESGR